MAGKLALKHLIVEYQDALKEHQLMARLMKSGHVEAETLEDGSVGFRLTPKGWADIAHVTVPDLPKGRPVGEEVTLFLPEGTQCWRMTADGWTLAWWDPAAGADNWI